MLLEGGFFQWAGSQMEAFFEHFNHHR